MISEPLEARDQGKLTEAVEFMDTKLSFLPRSNWRHVKSGGLTRRNMVPADWERNIPTPSLSKDKGKMEGRVELEAQAKVQLPIRT